ncbi:TP901 family phage tail tape measure protein [Agrobacterium vitis]|nr:TP901 family phage tail tape measure protein [Agrobacterium vitis]MBE1440553.1 TP901 family phage tail tape measure protein [Agrobacterium vitis]
MNDVLTVAKDIGDAVSGISFKTPIKEAASFQQQLLDISLAQGLSGKQAFQNVADMKRQFQDLALATGQSSQNIATAAGQMMAAGLDRSLVDASIGTIARTATAANADVKDMASVATSLMQNLKVPADQMAVTLDGLVVGGKLGGMQMKDMVRYFPALTGQMAKLGLSGREAAAQLAAMLEIAAKGTADPAEAASNLNGFLSKITSSDVKKNFEKIGVDLQGVMQDAALQGINPLDAVIQKIADLTGTSGTEINGLMQKAKANGLSGAEALEDVRKQLEAIHGTGALGDLFSDPQATGFLVSALAHLKEYKDIHDQIKTADGSTTLKDHATQMQGLGHQQGTLTELQGQISDETGNAVGAWLPALNDNIKGALDGYRQFNAETNGLGRDLLSLGGGAIVAAGLLGTLAAVLQVLSAGFRIMAAPLRLAVRLFERFSSASDGVKNVADQLERVNTATTNAGKLKRPSIWGTLFAAGNIIDMVDEMPSDPEGIEKYLQGRRDKMKPFEKWWLDNIGTPRTWVGLHQMTMEEEDENTRRARDNPPIPKVEVNPQEVKDLRTSMTDITKSWPIAAQIDIRDFQNVLLNGGDNAAKKAQQIGQDIKDQLTIAGSVDIETGRMDEALRIATQLAATLKGVRDFSPPVTPPVAANQNPLPTAPLPASGSPTTTPPQPVNVHTAATFSVDGPGQLTSHETTVTSPSPGIDTGRAIGRN